LKRIPPALHVATSKINNYTPVLASRGYFRLYRV
jgi:hypothetical protein